MSKPAASCQEYYEAKAAFNKAETEWRKVRNAYMPLSWKDHARSRGTEATEEFQRAEQAYHTAVATLSDARERLRLLRSSLPVRKYKPYKYGILVEEGEHDLEAAT
jgi:hypothetical protein